MTDKKDWEQVLQKTKEDKINITKSYELQIPQMEALIEFLEKKIKEFPEDDPKPEGVDELLK